jgi:hypothetical protein
MFSSRFQRKVVLTRHARDRMAERNAETRFRIRTARGAGTQARGLELLAKATAGAAQG